MRNSEFNSYKIKKCCEKKLNIHFRDRKECNGWFILDGKKAARITIPKGRKETSPKTYKTMATQLMLNIQQFDALLECTLKKSDYENILKM